MTKEFENTTSADVLIDSNAIERSKADYERNRVKYSLDACLENLRDRKKDLDDSFEGVSKAAGWEKAFVIISTEIEEAVRGKMIVPRYSQKSMALQEIYVFVGSHWELIPIQMYYDFIRDACQRLGLSILFYQNYKYMNKVFEQIAFSVSKHICTAQPHDGVWINLQNVTVEVYGDGTITTHEHRAEDFFLYCVPYTYNPQAECPRWFEFLDEVLPEKASQQLLGEYIGYCFTRNLKLEKMAVFYGSGANGKSVVLDVIKSLMGRVNVSEATLSSVTNDPEARCILQNKLVNISSESGKNLNPAILKMLVSGEPVEMRKLYVGVLTLNNPPKLITSYNVLPKVENTHGYKRRWILFPFNKTIPDAKQDPMLASKLCKELPGILNWVLGSLRGLLMKVQADSGADFAKSEVCQAALNDYFKDANSVTTFIDECCRKDDSVSVALKELYAQYVEYCRCCGITKITILKNFKKALIEWGAKESRHASVRKFNVWVDGSVYN